MIRNNTKNHTKMNTYKDLEIYKMAFNLAIKVYRINVILPDHVLLNQGNKLRRSTIAIKDSIAEGLGNVSKEDDRINHLIQAKVSCDVTILLLTRIKKIYSHDKALNEVIRSYIKLKNKINDTIQDLSSYAGIIAIPYPENLVLEPEI